MKNFMKKRLNKKGFTLVELIVVIAIVAVLAVIGIPAIAGQVSKAKQSTADSNAALIAKQAQIMITQRETAGDAYSAIATAFPDGTAANVCTEAGVPAKAGAVSVTYGDVLDVDGSTKLSKKVTKVTVSDGSIVGQWPKA